MYLPGDDGSVVGVEQFDDDVAALDDVVAFGVDPREKFLVVGDDAAL